MDNKQTNKQVTNNTNKWEKQAMIIVTEKNRKLSNKDNGTQYRNKTLIT